MSINIEELETFTALNCSDYDASWFSRVLVLTRYTPVFITLLMYVSGLWYKEIYLLLFGIGLSLDSAINSALQELIAEPVPEKHCGGPYGMPSDFAQHTAFLYAMLATFPILYSQRIGLLNSSILTLVVALVFAAQTHLHYNTREQVLVGSCVGALLGFAYQLGLYTFVYPYFNTILCCAPLSTFGYVDSWCRVRAAPVAFRETSDAARVFLQSRVWPVLCEFFIFPEGTDVLAEIEASLVIEKQAEVNLPLEF